jgi:hypothetical protein
MPPAMLADVVLVVHFAYAAFVVLGFLAIVAAPLTRWGWARNRAFRWVHLLAMAFVGLEALIGMACPLTVWEYALRSQAGRADDETPFIARLAAQLLYYRLPSWVFTASYLALTLLALLLWHWVPPRPRGG